MVSSPGTVSKILWHFTGGPRWNRKTKSQNKKPKPEAEAYAALMGILETRQLRIGRKEQVSLKGVAITVLDSGREDIVDSAYRNALVTSSPVCCLADIPIIHLGYHANRYGRFAIGFHREKALDAGFSPVFYQVEHSRTLGMLYAALYTINDFCAINIGSIIERINEDPSIASDRPNLLARSI